MVDILDEMPGGGRHNAQDISAEIGPDMSRFPTEATLAAHGTSPSVSPMPAVLSRPRPLIEVASVSRYRWVSDLSSTSPPVPATRRESLAVVEGLYSQRTISTQSIFALEVRCLFSSVR